MDNMREDAHYDEGEDGTKRVREWKIVSTEITNNKTMRKSIKNDKNRIKNV